MKPSRALRSEGDIEALAPRAGSPAWLVEEVDALKAGFRVSGSVKRARARAPRSKGERGADF